MHYNQFSHCGLRYGADTMFHRTYFLFFMQLPDFLVLYSYSSILHFWSIDLFLVVMHGVHCKLQLQLVTTCSVVVMDGSHICLCGELADESHMHWSLDSFPLMKSTAVHSGLY